MDINNLIFCFSIAFAISLAATPFVISLAHKIGAVDVPDSERRVHKKPIPRLGGLAIFYGFLIALLCFAKRKGCLAFRFYFHKELKINRVLWQGLKRL